MRTLEDDASDPVGLDPAILCHGPAHRMPQVPRVGCSSAGRCFPTSSHYRIAPQQVATPPPAALVAGGRFGLQYSRRPRVATVVPTAAALQAMVLLASAAVPAPQEVVLPIIASQPSTRATHS